MNNLILIIFVYIQFIMINKTVSIPNSKLDLFLQFIQQHGLKEVVNQEDDLTVDQIEAISIARKSIKSNGGNSHEEVIKSIKEKYNLHF